jgi:glycosyltransferase involved in cell wall biosynthesis
MYGAARIAVIVPAFRVHAWIGRTLAEVPEFVDLIVVVDDASPDETAALVRSSVNPRVQLVTHEKNRGVGAAIASGYARALDEGADVLAVMAGDNQMSPDDLAAVIEPIVNGQADYVKGNRFVHPLWRHMPWGRRFAGKILAAVTRWTTGLSIDDSQCGYTALAAEAARTLCWLDLWPRYGYPNDLLGMLAARRLRVVEVPVRPVYQGEPSGIRPWHALVVLGVIVRRWWLGLRSKTPAPWLNRSGRSLPSARP